MARKIRIFSVLLIVAIIIGASVAINIVSNSKIDNVSKVNISENTSNSIKVSWKKTDKADGYKLYIKNSAGEYELLENIKDGNQNSYEFTDQKSATVYQIKVFAYKTYRDKFYESEEADELTIYTLPDTPMQKAGANNPQQLNIAWTRLDKIAGVEIQYGKDETFEETVTQDINDISVLSFDVTDLTVDDVYYSRIRSYFMLDDEKIYSEWSEVAQTTIVDKVVMSTTVDPNKPMVALSFDDGPGFAEDGSNPTEEILNTLEEYNARATFFMCPVRIESSNNFLEREIALGCELGNHTYDHKHLGNNVTAEDISRGSERIKELCGQAPTIFRCPGGIFTSVIQDECIKENMPLAYWSVDTKDWSSKNADAVYDQCMNDVYDGSIILMHDIYPSTAEAVKRIVPELIEQGYQIVTVTELITAKNGGTPPTPGEQYVTGTRINNDTH